MALIPSLLLVVLFITYKITTARLRERRFKAFAKQNACEKPVDLTGPWYRRHKRLQRILSLRKTGGDFIDDIIGSDFAQATTWEQGMSEGTRVIGTIEPANLQALLATQFQDYVTGERRYRILRPLIGRSIFTSDGPFWEHSRALFRPAFSRENINDLESTNFAVNALVSALGPVDNESGWTQNVDMLPLLYNFTLDTATEFLFGESVNSQDSAIRSNNPKALNSQTGEDDRASHAPSRQFGQDLDVVGHGIVIRMRMQSLYWLYDSFRFRKAIRSVKVFTEYFVQRAIDRTNTDKPYGKKRNLLSRLATETQDVEELRDQTLAILFAGRDTTSALMCWCFLRLAMHPEIFVKLRGIIMTDFADDEPTFAKLKSCRYLQHFLNEVLRLHPTVPLNSRIAARDTTLPVGGGPDKTSPIAIHKGQAILYSVYFMHRRADLWGPDALVFNPSRWEAIRPSWQFLPFSGGPRICLGQQYALTEAGFCLVKLLQVFDRIEPVDAVAMAKFPKKMGLTMPPGDGVRVRLHRAA